MSGKPEYECVRNQMYKYKCLVPINNKNKITELLNIINDAIAYSEITPLDATIELDEKRVSELIESYDFLTANEIEDALEAFVTSFRSETKYWVIYSPWDNFAIETDGGKDYLVLYKLHPDELSARLLVKILHDVEDTIVPWRWKRYNNGISEYYIPKRKENDVSLS